MDVPEHLVSRAKNFLQDKGYTVISYGKKELFKNWQGKLLPTLTEWK
jgi:hypothetical protein